VDKRLIYTKVLFYNYFEIYFITYFENAEYNFLRANYFMDIFKKHLKGAKTFLTPKLSRAQKISHNFKISGTLIVNKFCKAIRN
jgi:hypothetical protein